MTISRLGTANMYDRTIGNIQKQQAALASQMEHVSAGRRVLRTSDDPVAAAQAERAMTRLQRIETDQRILKAQEATITYAESTLRDIYRAVQDFRDLLVQAGDGAYNQVQRETLTEQMRHLREQLQSYVNRKDSNGLPLFRGLDTQTSTPFPNASNGIQSGQFNIGEYSITNALDGVRAFFSGQTGNGVLRTDVARPMEVENGRIALDGAGKPKPLDAAQDDGWRRAWIDAGVIKDPDAASALAATGGEVTITLVKDASGALNYHVHGEVDAQGQPVTTANPRVLENGKTAYKSGQTIRVQGMDISINGEPKEGDTFVIRPSQQASLFSVLDEAITTVRTGAGRHNPSDPNANDPLDNGGTNTGKLATGLARSLSEVDIALNRVSTVLGTAGSMMKLAGVISNTLDEQNEQVVTARVNAEGYTERELVAAYSQLNAQQTAVTAALQSYASIQKLSLFDYIR